MKVTCIGGAGTVTGSCFLIESEDVKILIDCGMFQGARQLEERNYLKFPFDPHTVSHLLLTHAHIDHSGLVPKLFKEGFAGSILCTTATADLCGILFKDSAHIQEMEAEWRNRKQKRAGRSRLIYPLYTKDDVARVMDCFQPLRYGQEIQLSSSLRACFHDAGHILGSAIVELWVKENDRDSKLVFSGDLGSTGQPIIRDPTPIAAADVVFIESTYGARLHKSKESTYEELQKVIHAAYRDGGNVIIPAFAVERTQEVLYILNELYNADKIPPMNVYVDSPLAVRATEIFLKHPECFDKETLAHLRAGDHPLDFPGMNLSRTREESMRLNTIQKGAIFIAASGMAHAGRIKHHLRHNIWRPECHIVFVGYQAQGTTGRRIVDGAKTVTIFGEPVAVNAQIHTIGGFSAHADRDGLLNWLTHFEPVPKAVVIIHGEAKSSIAFGEEVRKRIDTNIITPGLGEQIDLDAALDVYKELGVALPSLKFDEEVDLAWQELGTIMARLRNIEDIDDHNIRQSLSSKIHYVNEQLAEIVEYLAGKELE